MVQYNQDIENLFVSFLNMIQTNTTDNEKICTKNWDKLTFFIDLKTGSLTTDNNLLDLVAITAPMKPIHKVICWTISWEAGIEKKFIYLPRIWNIGKDIRMKNKDKQSQSIALFKKLFINCRNHFFVNFSR